MVRHVKRKTVVADFETTTDPEDCRVWGFGVHEVGTPAETVLIGNSIDSFIEYISGFNSVCYFHNLKFDSMFIIYWLLTHDYLCVTSRKVPAGCFGTLISDMGKFYTVTVSWENGNKTEFRDSLKKLPMPVRDIAKTFNLPVLKGELDYSANRAVGHVITDDEREYIVNDVLIVSLALQVVLDAGMKKLTVGSDSMHEYKTIIGEKLFGRLFPTLNPVIDADIRAAYRGGFTYAAERFRGKRLGAGIVFDVNSLYPAVMYDCELPYGEPTIFQGAPEEIAGKPLQIFSVTFTAKLKPNHVPCIQVKGTSMFTETEYVTEISEPTALWVTSVDWDLYSRQYDIDVQQWHGGYAFAAARGMFDAYIDKWTAVKENSVGGERALAKLHLNSLYGKFGSNPSVTSKFPELVDDTVKLLRGADETRAPVYTALAAFVTAYARNLTISAAQDNYEVFAYADTDSLHLITDTVPAGLEIHETRRGAWALEYHFTEALYMRAKAYLTLKPDGTYKNAIAGLPVGVSRELTFADAYDGNVIWGKLVPKSVPGGVVLVDVGYKLKM